MFNPFDDIAKAFVELFGGGNKEKRLESYLKQNSESPDIRYKVPKEQPKVPESVIDKVIEETEIYREAKEHILKAQRGQVAYGIEKYPEPLNADTWTIIETIDHAIDESVDKLHYLVMLRIKLEREAIDLEEIKKILRIKSPSKIFSGVDKHGHPDNLRGEDMFATKEAKVSDGLDDYLRRVLELDKQSSPNE